jgi:hypothetical protein
MTYAWMMVIQETTIILKGRMIRLRVATAAAEIMEYLFAEQMLIARITAATQMVMITSCGLRAIE